MRYFIYCRKSSEAEDRQVASIESQLSALQRTFGERGDIEIIDIYQEAYSAKSPGRPQFGGMLARIEKGDAHGIIAWAPDRLSRNSIDGGRLIYMLDCGTIRDLKFASYSFENNSQGKFMLQIMFGQSKYYSDALSDNVKRGNQTKIDNGWRPNQAPLGYLNDPATKTIVKDPVHFPLVRKMFELMITGAYGPKQIAVIAREDWGFRTPQKKRIGGKPLAMSSMYKILSNPFYAGLIVWNGQVYPGKHEPVVSIDDFETAQKLMQRPGRPKRQRHRFAFTGMIRCGSCGRQITAENKTNRYGYRYVYYHCSKPHLAAKCPERSIEVNELENQIVAFLRTIRFDPSIKGWIYDETKNDTEAVRLEEQARRQSLERALADVRNQLDELTGLRLRHLLTDQEFVRERQRLQQERLRFEAKIAEADQQAKEPIEPFSDLALFNSRAVEWFSIGDNQTKRLILETVGSNLFLKAQIVNIEAKKPFRTLTKTMTIPHRLGVVDDVRTLRGKFAKVAKTLVDQLQTEDGKAILRNIKTLRERFDPETKVKKVRKKPPHPPWAEAA